MNNHQESQEKFGRISVTIPEPLLQPFKDLCRKERRSVSAQLTLLIEQALQHKSKNA